jgi:hypothetical protein
MFQTKYPEMFNKVVNEIKPYFNSHNDINDIYKLFINIADNASLQYVLVSNYGGDILTIDDMESYNILISDKDWMKKMFQEIKLKLTK